MAVRSILVGVAVSVVDPSNPHMRLDSRDSLQTPVLEIPSEASFHSLAVDPIGRLNSLEWRVPALLDVTDGADPKSTLTKKIQAAAAPAAPYKSMLGTDGSHQEPDHNVSKVMRTAAPEANISAPMISAVNAFMGAKGAKGVPPRPANVSQKLPQRPADQVEQAEEAKEEKAEIEAAKAKEEELKATTKSKNTTLTPEAKAATAAAEANKTAPLSSTVKEFLPLSLISLRPATPPEGRLLMPPKAYERKRDLLWRALSSGMSISVHHDMPVSRSLSLLEFVHTTHSHRTLALIVPGVVVTLVLVAMTIEQLPFWGMIKCGRGRIDLQTVRAGSRAETE